MPKLTPKTIVERHLSGAGNLSDFEVERLGLCFENVRGIGEVECVKFAVKKDGEDYGEAMIARDHVKKLQAERGDLPGVEPVDEEEPTGEIDEDSTDAPELVIDEESEAAFEAGRDITDAPEDRGEPISGTSSTLTRQETPAERTLRAAQEEGLVGDARDRDEFRNAEHNLSKEIRGAIAVIQTLKEMGEDDDKELVADMVEGQTSLEDAVNAVLLSMDRDAVLIAGLDEHVKALQGRLKRFKDRVDRKKATIEQAMRIAETQKFELPTATISLRTTAPKLVIEDEDKIPAEYFTRPDPVVDKKKLGDAVKAYVAALEAAEKDADGKPLEDLDVAEIPGAHLDNGGFSLQVRRG